MKNANKKIFISIILVVLLVVFVAGGTYAWYSWRVEATVGGGVTDDCFDITYVKGSDIVVTDTSHDYLGGGSSSFNLKIASGCNTRGLGNIYINVTSYNDTNGNSLINSGAAKYVLKENDSIIKTGYLTKAGKTFILKDFILPGSNDAPNNYVMYIWLDDKVATTNYAGATLNAYIGVDAVFNEKVGS